MARLVIETTEGIQLRREIAGAGGRLCAGILDVLLLIGVALLMMVVGIGLNSMDIGFSDFVLGLLAGGFVLVLLAYSVVFHILMDGQTPGKRWTGLRVISTDGGTPTAYQYLLRGLIWPVDVFIPVPIPLGLAFIALTRHRQRLGDLAAGTLVVYEVASLSSVEPWPGLKWTEMEEPELDLTPGMAAGLSGQDFDMLRRTVTRTGMHHGSRRRIFGLVAKHYCKRLNLPEPKDTRRFLRELYIFMREMRGEQSPRVETT